MKWTFSAFTDEAGASLHEQMNAIERAGLRFVDLRLIEGQSVAEIDFERARVWAGTLREAGITVAMFGSPIGKIDIGDPMSGEWEKLEHLARLAPLFECGVVRIFSYFNRDALPHPIWRERALERLTQLRDRARELGLVLYHENERHIYGERATQVLEIAALRDAHFKTIFDFDNFVQAGESVAEVWRVLAPVTDGFHLKDSSIQSGAAAQHCLLGQGDGCAREILSDAVARGWSGPVAVEPHLSRSLAVIATGPGGQVAPSFAQMAPADSFDLAVRTASDLLTEIGAPWH